MEYQLLARAMPNALRVVHLDPPRPRHHLLGWHLQISLHLPTATAPLPLRPIYRAASNRIAALVSAGLLSRVFYHPRLTAHTGRPASILYLQSENLATLATLLARRVEHRSLTDSTTSRQPTATISPTASSCTSSAFPTSTLPLNYPTAPRPLFSGSAPARKWKA